MYAGCLTIYNINDHLSNRQRSSLAVTALARAAYKQHFYRLGRRHLLYFTGIPYYKNKHHT